MNARQAAKAAAKRIEDLEDFNRRSTAEVKNLNRAIDSVIAGEKSFCDWCEEADECQQPEKKLKTGCENWWLRMDLPEEEKGEADDTETISGASGEC